VLTNLLQLFWKSFLTESYAIMQKGIMASDGLSLHDWAGAHGVSEGRRKHEYEYSYSLLFVSRINLTAVTRHCPY